MTITHRLTTRLRSEVARALTGRSARPLEARGPRVSSGPVRPAGRSDCQAYTSSSSSSASQQASSSSSGTSSAWSDGVAAQAIFGSLGGVLILGFDICITLGINTRSWRRWPSLLSLVTIQC
ncbi:hypothetical protein PGTUg99_029433 [Puccinia graminis f. sp. tritici]|uniref:Uncharacterized protein n=1 Tax=Puccinia graminis f. sp. tritici TaxID=56615 RepID=A0A5B0RN69_PUCGR|nr:hypothetical protein PGTUg99_029433 [Puccinia graminis f. sp. tritici]